MLESEGGFLSMQMPLQITPIENESAYSFRETFGDTVFMTRLQKKQSAQVTISNNLNKKTSAKDSKGSARNLAKRLEVPQKQISDQRRSSAIISLPSISRLRAGVNDKT